MTQFEVYKSFQFVAELLLAETLYVFRLPRRSFFPLRLLAALAAIFLFSYFFPILSNDAFYISFIFLTIFLVSLLLTMFVFKTTWFTVIFCCIAGYTTQHIAYELYIVLLNLIGVMGETPMGFYGSDFIGMYNNLFLLSVYLGTYLFTYFICFYCFSERLKTFDTIQLKTVFVFSFSILIFVIDVLLNAIIVSNLSTDGQTRYMVIFGIYSILCCLISLYLQFTVALEVQLKSTLDSVRRMYDQAKEQYASSKANIETINVRCHDLKHLIYLIENGGTVSSTFLKDIKSHISVYESESKTGNVALDIILTEKGLLCNKNDIRLSCVVDGKELEFMEEEDIYVLFGNIIDNAIEAVMKLESEKRVISIHVRRVNGFLLIKETNYCDGPIKFLNGLPITTKKDKSLHGLGMKSIQYICEQYNGNMSIEQQGDKFCLALLLSNKSVGQE